MLPLNIPLKLVVLFLPLIPLYLPLGRHLRFQVAREYWRLPDDASWVHCLKRN
jgi:hypothetical protein